MIHTAQVGVMAERLHISEREWQIVAEILARHLPGKAVWAFGSRATGLRVKKFSDLDLAVEGTLTWAQRAAVNEALDESLLNFKVDVVELGLIDAEFLGRIEKDLLLLPRDAGGDTKANARSKSSDFVEG